MTETKWTPGPWFYDEHGQDGHGDYVVSNGMAITRIMGDSAFVPANAHLIAAAPELYEALKQIVDSVSSGPSGDVCQTSDFDDARAALAKARGET